MKELINHLQKQIPYATRSYLPKEVLFLQGSPSVHIFFIEQGWLRVAKYTAEGRDCTVDICGPGHFIGLPTLFQETPYPISVSAMTELIVSIFEKSAFETVLLQKPEYMAKAIVELGQTVFEIKELTVAMGSKDALERVCNLLIHLAVTYGKESKNGWKIPFKLTYQYISDILGLTRVTVSNCIKHLEDNKVIITKGKDYTILKTLNHDFDEIIKRIV